MREKDAEKMVVAATRQSANKVVRQPARLTLLDLFSSHLSIKIGGAGGLSCWIQHTASV